MFVAYSARNAAVKVASESRYRERVRAGGRTNRRIFAVTIRYNCIRYVLREIHKEERGKKIESA